jgi:hypothetical protein
VYRPYFVRKAGTATTTAAYHHHNLACKLTQACDKRHTAQCVLKSLFACWNDRKVLLLLHLLLLLLERSKHGACARVTAKLPLSRSSRTLVDLGEEQVERVLERRVADGLNLSLEL